MLKTADSTRTLTQTGVKRRTVRIVRRPRLAVVADPEPSAETTFDEFGQRLHLFACVLTDDTELAEQLVVQTVLAHQHGSCTLQDLSAGVYIAWIAWGAPPLLAASPPSPTASRSALMLHELHGLPADQRAALALCKYGDHDYRRAAKVLELAPDCVARLLGHALRAIALPPAMQARPVPAA